MEAVVDRATSLEAAGCEAAMVFFCFRFAHVEGLCKRIPLKETLRSFKGNAQNEITTC
jgi:hypothetical protein